jgi:hypothetical protein
VTYPTDEIAGVAAGGTIRTLTPPWHGQPHAEAARDVLLSWCRVNGLAPDRMLDRDRIEIHAADSAAGRHYIILWLEALPADPVGPGRETSTALRKTPLLIEPEGLLAGELTCGHVHSASSPVVDEPPLFFTCDQGIDPATGRHPGQHAGSRSETPRYRRSDTGNGYRMSWPNEHPGEQAFREGLPYVGDMTPAAAHALVLARLGEITDRRPRVNRRQVLIAIGPHVRGLRAIVERHGPVTYGEKFPAACQSPDHAGAGPSFPCADYRDATAGIVTL